MRILTLNFICRYTTIVDKNFSKRDNAGVHVLCKMEESFNITFNISLLGESLAPDWFVFFSKDLA